MLSNEIKTVAVIMMMIIIKIILSYNIYIYIYINALIYWYKSSYYFVFKYQIKTSYLKAAVLYYITRLGKEMLDINRKCDELKAKLREAESVREQLLRTKAQLEEELTTKTNTLYIDREKCLGLRKTFPMPPRQTCK